MQNLTLTVAKEMQVNAVITDDSVIYKRGHFTITSKGAVWEDMDALDQYITETGDPAIGLDAYMRDTEVAHNFAEIARVIDKQIS